MSCKLYVFGTFLVILTAVCGCSDAGTAEKRLANELKTFAAQYVKKEFAEQIQLNGQCKAFRLNENKLLLLGFDGIEAVQRQLPYNDLIEFAVARYYVGQELDIKCNEASWSKLTAVNHERYKYRALITYKFTDTRRMWQHVPGNCIAVTAFKNQANPDQLKAELLNMAVKELPDERFDYQTIYSRSSDGKERKFTVSFFVSYDPSLPGWVPEDPEFAAEIKVNAVAPDWLDCSIDKFNPAPGTELYKEDLYWRNSKVIRKNYDAGLVFFRNRWMPQAEAQENIRFDELINKFDPDRAGIGQLTSFLQAIKSFSDQIDKSRGLQKAVDCAENHINNLRNGDKYQELERFHSLMLNNSVYGREFETVRDDALQAISVVKRRINRQLENSIGEIKKSLDSILDLNSGREFTPMQINIECVRRENVLKKICPQDAAQISGLIFQIRFLLLLKRNYITEVNKLYKYSGYKEQLRFLEKTVLRNCKNCRKGLQKCIYCKDSPGICSDCEGKRPIGDEKCPTCKSNGLCVHCQGRRTMKCMNCQGRSFIILHNKVEELCAGLTAELEKVLKNNQIELENKKLPQ